MGKPFLETRTDLTQCPLEAVALHKEACDVLADSIIFVLDDSMTKQCEPKVDFHRFRQGCCSCCFGHGNLQRC